MKKSKRPHSGRTDKRAGVIKKIDLHTEQKHQPKKSLGQHFLTSKSVLGKIIDAGDPSGDDIIIEVGPGKGILTESLLIFAGKVIAIEKDRMLVTQLREKFSKAITENRLDLIEGDILDFDPSVMEFYKRELEYKVIANIPYYITNAIIRLFLESTAQPSTMVLLIQKEVAERIVARNKKESLLSIAVKAYGTPKIVAKVPAGAFNPPPKVDSAILVIEDISKKHFQNKDGTRKTPDSAKNIDEKTFFAVVRAGFAHKRKKLAGNLTILYKKDKIKEVFEQLGMTINTRAEDITMNGWLKLVEELEK